MASKTASFLDQELSYIASLPIRQQQASIRDIQIGMYVLSGLGELTNEMELSKKIKYKLKELEGTFSKSLG